MKRIFLVFILLLSIELSKGQLTTDKMRGVFKCFISSQSNIDKISSFIEALFKENNAVMWLSYFYQLQLVIKDCIGIDLVEIAKEMILGGKIKLLSQQKTYEILAKLKNSNAPILLRKYLYDYISQNGLEHAKKQCDEITREKPYDKFKNICLLFRNNI